MSQFSDEIDVEFQKWTAMMLDKKDAEITRLRADLAAVTEERDRMRTRLDKAHGFISRADWAQFFEEEHVDARAALEGVTEPATGETYGQ